MAFGTNCLRRRKVLFLLFADLGYNQGNKQEQYALRKTERLEIIMTKEQITGTLAMWRRVKKKMRRLLKNPGILGLSHL